MRSPLVVILGAGRPFTGTNPSALIQPSGNRRVLDWLLDAFEQALPDPEFHFVGGYQLDEIVEEYPDIRFSRNEEWETSGTVASLFTAPLSPDRPTYVCYADTIFEGEVVDALDGETTVAVDRSWRTRHRSRSEESLAQAEKVRIEDGRLVDAGSELEIERADAEFTGLLRLPPAAVDRAKSLWESRTLTPETDLPDLLRALTATGIEIETVAIDGQWVELESAENLSRFVLDTKANTLRRLQSRVERSEILDQYTFTVERWKTDADVICSEIREAFDRDFVIVRSSALSEDGFDSSNAGRFESVLEVPREDPRSLANAIADVIDSYVDENPGNQVLVQPMIDEVDQSGVVMTRSLETGSPYYVINYDATTASTESVTDGTGEHLQTAIVRKDFIRDGDMDVTAPERSPQYPRDLSLEPLLAAVHELEELIGHDSLDVEFAIDANGDVYVLQARPMTVDPTDGAVHDQTLFETVDQSRREFTESQTAPPFVFGDRTVYGVMPDWNPAEIIGRQPRPLAASLYRSLIMNEVWAQQRAEYGYRDVRPHPLMRSFAGQPYVDVRADFNSFVPASVPADLAERLVEHYLDRLRANPELHDKVEFDIVLTCLTFDYGEQIQPLLDAGFTAAELEPLRNGLREITREAFDRIEGETEKIDHLEDRYREITDAGLPPLEGAYYLLQDCRRLGTLPFAHLARTAFVATALLRSLERIGVLTEDERSAFQNSLNTVAREFERDGYRVSTGDLAWKEFVEEYGHLRPGTYDITSPAYKQNPEEYLQPIAEVESEPETHPDPADVWDAGTKRAIGTELERIGLTADVDEFIDFLVRSIEGREYSKFVFSRNLSEALERIAEFGEDYGLSREDLSYLSIDAIFELNFDVPHADIRFWFEERVRIGREKHGMTTSVELPPLLFDGTDFLVFERPTREPNYVTTDTVTANSIELDEGETEPDELDGSVVLISRADPGYDWIFGHDIAGLVTMYGGSNSHMAVRAAEFSLPAVIGVGENQYERLRRADVLELDCETRDTRVIQ